MVEGVICSQMITHGLLLSRFCREMIVKYNFHSSKKGPCRVCYSGPVKGELYLLVIDAMSKWVKAEITVSQTSAMTVTKFRIICARFGLRDTVVTDYGPVFAGAEFQRFLNEICI